VTLRVRLLLLVVCTVAAGLVISDVVTYNALRSFLVTRVDQQLDAAAYPVGRALLSPSAPGGSGSTPAVVRGSGAAPASSVGGTGTAGQGRTSRGGVAFRNGGGQFAGQRDRGVLVPPGTYGQLRNAEGKVEGHVLFSYGERAPGAPVLPVRLPGAGLPAGADSYFNASGSGSGAVSYRAVAKPLRNGGVVVVAVPLTDLEGTLRQLLLIELVVSLVVLAVLAVLSWVMVRRDLRPLEEITDTAGAIAHGDLTQRVTPIDDKTEVGQLGATFNTMLDEIEAAFGERAASEERLRRFLADASHELRTPLTSIRGYAELFDLGVRNRPADLETAMRHIHDEAGRMSALVDDLFLLAQLDHERPLRHERVDLAEVAMSSAESATVSAPDRVVEVDAPSPVILDGDPDRLRQVVDNLVVNALAYSNGAVWVGVSAPHGDDGGSRAVLTVHDEGPGIDPADLASIFEPFFRSDPSRARSSGGAGLGLAIVAAIVRAHGGVVTARPGRGATFVVELPVEAAGAEPIGTEPTEAEPPADSGSGAAGEGTDGASKVARNGGTPPAAREAGTPSEPEPDLSSSPLGG
jgi:two-component system, OmpR family, sensor kinase